MNLVPYLFYRETLFYTYSTLTNKGLQCQSFVERGRYQSPDDDDPGFNEQTLILHNSTFSLNGLIVFLHCKKHKAITL